MDPDLAEIVIKFDRPMKKGHYFLWGADGPDRYPAMKAYRFDESGTVFTIFVSLRPGRSYAVALNEPGGGTFQSEEGVLLKHAVLRFETAGRE